jgi:hypothetical protein
MNQEHVAQDFTDLVPKTEPVTRVKSNNPLNNQ